VRIKNLSSPGGVPIREIRIENPRPPQPWETQREWLEDTNRRLIGLDGEFMCVENCIPDNGPGAGFSRHVWTLDGANPAPPGAGLETGRDAAHLRYLDFDIDQDGAYLGSFEFTITWADGYTHFFDYDNDALGLGIQGQLFQKYEYFLANPRVAGPLPADYYEFVRADCGNGLDDDGDGLTDAPADTGCTGPDDFSELEACADGVDNDGDGLVDFAADPGCASLVWAFEDPQCNDALDNDGDGAVDLNDPQCWAPWRNREARRCGIGVELALLAPLLDALARRRRPLREGRRG
jgi:hypothetical protein